jgi:hypothetical protein
MSTINIWKELSKKFNVFHLHKENYPPTDWEKAIGKERILWLKHPKACIDVALGVIAITSGARTLETYVNDMKSRG